MQAQFSKQQAIEEITRRLVEFYTPVRIYLFGSEARGEAGPENRIRQGHRAVAQDRFRGSGSVGQVVPASHRRARRQAAL